MYYLLLEDNLIKEYLLTNIKRRWTDIINNREYKKFLINEEFYKSILIKNNLIIKLSKWDNNILKEEYNNMIKLNKISNFIKYLFYIEKKEDFIDYLYNNDELKEQNNSIIIKPYYNKKLINNITELYNDDLLLCIRQIILAYYDAYINHNIIFLDININEIYIKKYKNPKKIEYNIDNKLYIITTSYEIIIDNISNIIIDKISNIKKKYKLFNISLVNILTKLEHYNIKFKSFLHYCDVFTNDNPLNNLNTLLHMIMYK